jgi:hypothetical protein
MIVLATHDLDVVDGLLTRALFLINGKQSADTSAARGSLRERYQAAVSACRDEAASGSEVGGA